MSNYYKKKDAKINIALRLQQKGWKIYGYKPNQSDSMTDYYDPAYWEGIAAKNGYTLVVDNSTPYNSNKEITKYNPKNSISLEDRNKIEKLSNMTTKRGCTIEEQKTAEQMIENIKAKTKDLKPYEVVDQYPSYMGNSEVSPRCIIHLEKDGKIYYKSSTLTKFADIPGMEYNEFNYDKMEFTERYKYTRNYDDTKTERTLSDEKLKNVKAFNKMINELEKIVNIDLLHNGTEEGKEQARNEQKTKMEKVTEKKIKKVLKMVEIKDRDYVKNGDILGFTHRGGYWLVTRDYMRKGIWNIKGERVTEERKAFSYERLGSEKRGYQQVKNTDRFYKFEYDFIKELKESKIKIYELKEIEEVQEVEKWVKVNKESTPKTTKTTSTTQKAYNKATPSAETVKTSSANNKTEITEIEKENIKEIKLNDELNGIEIYFYSKPSADTISTLKKYNFRYHKLKYWYAKQTPERMEFINTLKNDITEPTPTTQQADPLDELIEGYIYNVHFKIWDLSAEEIIKLIEIVKVKYRYDPLWNKFFFDNVDFENALLLQKISNNNGSIFFIDKAIKEIDYLKQIAEEEKTKILKEEQKQKERIKLVEKANKNIESLTKKIDGLSGDHLTNTYKRMNEQATRDSKINSYNIDININNYILEKLTSNIDITQLEKGIISSSVFFQDIHQYYIRKYGKYPSDIKYPVTSSNYGEWYNVEVPKKQNRLKKCNITDTEQLNKAIDEYKVIYNNCDIFITPTQQKIKTLTNQYKMQQKGDIHFTDNKELLNHITELADIQQGDRVLEPSAGIGSICDKLKEYTNNIDCCEYMFSYSELLKLKGYNVVCNDFMELKQYNRYDKIVANVPFSKEQEHIKHIYDCLKVGGRAVVITSPHYTFANDNKSKEFRTWLDDITHEIEDVKEKSFTHTNVNCKILIIEKEEETKINDVAV